MRKVKCCDPLLNTHVWPPETRRSGPHDVSAGEGWGKGRPRSSVVAAGAVRRSTMWRSFRPHASIVARATTSGEAVREAGGLSRPFSGEALPLLSVGDGAPQAANKSTTTTTKIARRSMLLCFPDGAFR